MITFLFWNLMGNQSATWSSRSGNLRTRLANMAATYGVDVFLFAESAFDSADLLALLNQKAAGTYAVPPNYNQRIQVISRLPAGSMISQYDSVEERLTIRRLRTVNADILLAVLHFQSQAAWDVDSLGFQTTTLREDIERTEADVGHHRTVLVGDLNLNPFDRGLIAAQGLNAVMTQDVAGGEERTVSGRPYRFFYNPMWGFFGDRTQGPPGSYYYSASAPVNYYWNIFDQVLLRPGLMAVLDELRILDTDGQTSLLTERGRPRSAETSDHLPLLFRLRL